LTNRSVTSFSEKKPDKSSELKKSTTSDKENDSNSQTTTTNFWSQPDEKGKKPSQKVDEDQKAIQAFAIAQGFSLKRNAEKGSENIPENRLKKQRSEWLVLFGTDEKSAKLNTQRDLLEEQIKDWQNSLKENFVLKTVFDFRELRHYVDYLKVHEERLYHNVLHNIPPGDLRYKKAEDVEMQFDNSYKGSSLSF
jgi:hypothetical protein